MKKQKPSLPLALFLKLSMVLTNLLPIQLLATSPSPTPEGSLGAHPFINQYVDILDKDIFIKIEDKFTSARFKIKYHIESSKSGLQIPFVFYAVEYRDAFTVTIDGKEVKLQGVPSNFNTPDETKFKDFPRLYQTISIGGDKSILVNDSVMDYFHLTPRDVFYFEAHIQEGKHVIEVNYEARAWLNPRNWVNAYSFRYELSPTKRWKSLKTLDIKIDATAFQDKLSSNLGEPNLGLIDSFATWHFEKPPTDILQIKYGPKMNKVAQGLIWFRPENLGFCTGFLLAVSHIVLLVGYRKKNPNKRFSKVLIVGSLSVPLLFLACWIGNYYLIDVVIGEHASGEHGYIVFLIFFYPFILPVYWVTCWLVDRWVKIKAQGL